MGPILFNEGTTNGTYEVTDTIFLYQLKLNENMNSDRFFLVYGDQKTAQLLHCSTRRASSTAAITTFDLKAGSVEIDRNFGSDESFKGSSTHLFPDPRSLY